MENLIPWVGLLCLVSFLISPKRVPSHRIIPINGTKSQVIIVTTATNSSSVHSIPLQPEVF